MANLIDERLEGAGYEETWSLGEVLGGGATLDEDFAVSSVTGAPANWGDDCLEHIYVAANNCYVGDVDALIPDPNICWIRFEFIWNAESLANSEQNLIAHILGTGATVVLLTWSLFQSSGGVSQILFQDQRDGAGHFLAVNLAADTPIVLETLWDITNDITASWADGVVLLADVALSSGREIIPVDALLWGAVAGSVDAAATTYRDNLIVNDGAQERVGTGRFLHGVHSINGGVSTKTLNPSHSLGGQLNGALQAA